MAPIGKMALTNYLTPFDRVFILCVLLRRTDFGLGRWQCASGALSDGWHRAWPIVGYSGSPLDLVAKSIPIWSGGVALSGGGLTYQQPTPDAAALRD
jgi:hypothetical protein